MLHRVFPKKGAVLANLGRLSLGLLVPACFLVVPTTSNSQNDYLDALRLEEEKLDETAGSGGADEPAPGLSAVADEPLASFEQEFEASYRGTYLFYKKLPAKSKEEVFLEHQQGASIEDVRKTIMNRYLHSH